MEQLFSTLYLEVKSIRDDGVCFLGDSVYASIRLVCVFFFGVGGGGLIVSSDIKLSMISDC